MAAPSVYAAIHAVAAEFAESGIAKTRVNAVDGYDYRSIDDVLARLAPLLAKHRLCILPRVVDRSVSERVIEASTLFVHVALRAQFRLVSVDDASSHEVETYGEALDASDKATAKAMSAAYKIAILQTFCVPTQGSDDADASSPKVGFKHHDAEPVQGWRQWCEDIIEIVSSCQSEQALAAVQDRNRSLLLGISREQPELYSRLGEAFSARRAGLAEPAGRAKNKKSRVRGPAKARNGESFAMAHNG